MANFTYVEALEELLKGTINFASDDIRVLLVMTNTTADTEEDVTTFGDVTTLDEFDGSGYSAGGSALAGLTVTKDTADNEGQFDATNETFTSISAGTRQIQAAVVYRFLTSTALSMPLFFIDQGGFPFTPTGGNIVFQWHVDGIAYLTSA